MGRVIRIGASGALTDTAGILGPTPNGAAPVPIDAESPKPTYPSLARQGVNFARALAKWAAEGAETRTAEEINELLVICQNCPSKAYDPKGEACMLCGCPVKAAGAWRNKLAMKTEKCPKGHW